nr:uncharacterized mitochondrial protein AtMg00810-like [Tanacetum cinerariifolium]
MRIEQYFLMTDYSLWEVILNGDSPAPTRVVEGVLQPVSLTTSKQKLARKNELKARGTLIMALPDKHQLKFNSHKDAKTLMEFFSVWSSGSTNPQNTDGDDAFDRKEPEFDAKKPEFKVVVSPSSSAQSKKQDDKTKKEAKCKSPVESFTGYRNLSTEFEDFSDNSINEVNAAGTLVPTVGHNSPNSTNTFSAAELKDITYSDDDDVGAEADFNNLETSIIVSSIPTTRVHKDHPVTQIIDDIIFGLTNKDLCKYFEKLMKDKFQMSSMRELTFFLGLQVQQNKEGISISQDKYVAEILRKFGLSDGKSASTLIDTEKPLLKDPDGEDVDVHTYRSMIGSLMYLTSSRPDIMFAVCACTRFQMTPKASHLHAVKRIFRYLKGKPHLRLWYLKDSPFDLAAYSDSDYASESLDRKSTTGECQFLGCRLISWQCKKKTVIATSSTEAEYVSTASCWAQVLWIQNQLLDMVNPNIYVSCIKQFWTTVAVKKVNDVIRLQALVDKNKVVVKEATIGEALRLDDAEGFECLPNEEIFAELARMGYEKPSTKLTFYKAFFSSQWKFLIHTILECISAKRTSWNEFSSSMASAVICLSSGRKFNFSKKQVGDLSTHTTKYTSPALTQKVFANMRRIGKGFFGVEAPLFEGMLVAQQVVEEGYPDDNDENVNAGDAAEGDVSAATAEVPTVVKDSSTPSPIPPTPLPQPSQDILSTSQDAAIPMTLLQDLMDTYTVLSRRVEYLELDKIAQALEITKLKRRVKKLERGNKVKERMTMDADADVVLKDDKEVADAVKDGVVIRDTEEYSPSIIIPTETKSKDKGKGILVEEPKPLKKQAQIKQDEQFARELEAQLNRNIDWDEAIDHVKKKAKEDLTVKKYQVLKRKPQNKSQARKNMIVYLINVAGFKMDYFKGMSYDDIRPIFEAKFNSNVAFLQKTRQEIEEEESRALKRINETPAERAAKRQKEDLEALWSLVKEIFSTSKPKNFSDDFLQVTLGAMFEKLDMHAQIWKNQRSVHGPAKVKGWKLLESCGVQIITFTTTQLILLVERKYPLIRFTLDQMLNAVRLKVEEESEVSLELLRIVLSIKDKLNYLEQPIPSAHVVLAGQHVAPKILAAHTALIKGSKEIAGLMLMTMEPDIQRNLETFHAHEMLLELKTLFAQQAEHNLLQTTRDFHSCKQEEGQSVSSYVLKMKGYIDSLEHLGHPVTLGLGTINELHAMLKLHEKTLPKNNAPALHAIRAGKVQKVNKHKKSQLQMVARGQNHGKGKNKIAYAPKPKIPPPPKREDPANDSICHVCGETRHWKRNCPWNNMVYFSAILRDGIFEIDLSISYTNESSIYAVSNKSAKLDLDSTLLWNSRLGHINKKRIEKLQNNGLLNSTDLLAFEKCVPCMFGKMARKPYTYQVERAKHLLGLIHTMYVAHLRSCQDKEQATSPPSLTTLVVTNKVLVARNDEFLENSLITQEASGSLEDLEIIQEEDMHPSIDTSLNYEEDDLEIDKPQSDIAPIRRSTRTRHAPDCMCLYIDDEEHELGDLGEPANYKAALLDPESEKWLNAMNVEMQSMKDNEVWVLVDLPPNGKTIDPGTDYEETFFPVADIRAIRILIAIFAYYDYEIWQIDVKTAFLNGYLNEEVYMEQPEGKAAYILGIKIYRDRSWRLIGLCQSPYIEKNLKVILHGEFQAWKVSCYTDVGYLMNADDLKPQTRYVFILNGGVVDWKSAKQSIFATSSAEAEYIVAFDASKEEVWVRKFISRLGVVPTIEEPISMYCDNTEAIAIANESGITKGARHFRAKVHYLCEVIEYGDVKLEKVHTDDNLADPFTKALAFPKHYEY